MNRKDIIATACDTFKKLCLMPPPSKPEELAKLFKPYITDEAYNNLIQTQILPAGVVLNSAKFQDDDFFRNAIHSLGTHFNIQWCLSRTRQDDAVHFIYNDDLFHAIRTDIMANAKMPEIYSILKLDEFLFTSKQSAK
jgi:hypothetical protein